MVLGAGCWELGAGAGCWVLGARCWVLGAGCWVLVLVLVLGVFVCLFACVFVWLFVCLFVCLCVCVFVGCWCWCWCFVWVLLRARSVDLESLLGEFGSLLGVSFGSWGGKWPAGAKNFKNNTTLQHQALLAKQASPVCARCTSCFACFVAIWDTDKQANHE